MDATQVPLVRVTVEGRVSDADFRTYLLDSDRLIAAGARYVLLYDLLRAEGVTALQRRLQSEWIHKNEGTLHRLCLGAAFAIDSAIMRGTLTAILWISPLPFEHAVVPSIPEAEAWVRDRMP
jgi:hypothetical protein